MIRSYSSYFAALTPAKSGGPRIRMTWSDYAIAMVWSEEQKARGRAELARRKVIETASTYRASCLKAFGWMLGCILVIVAGVSDLYHQQEWSIRSGDTVLIATMLAGVAISGSLTYVRFLDWRRKAAADRGAIKL